MVYRPFQLLGRLGLAACAVSLGAASLSAQSASSTPAIVGPNPSRIDVFAGYSYYGAHGQVKPGYINYSSINLGAVGSGAYYFNKYIGGEVNYANHPDGVNDGFQSISAGMIARAPMQNYTLFAHGLVGAARLGGPNSEGPLVYHEPYMWGPTLTVGGGMDYDLPFLDNRFSLRLFEADYEWIHEDYGPYVGIPTGGVLGGRTNLNGVNLDTGIVMHFGHIIPPPPVTYSCAVSPSSVYIGDPITVTGTALNLTPKKTATYTWSSTGGTISGTSSTATVATTGVTPGTYSVKGHVSEGTKPGMMADCSADFVVKDYEPPTISCSASPSSVDSGGSSTITSTANSPQNRPLTYSYSASAGSVSGTGSTATLSTAGAAPGPITVTCNVVDDKGHQASTTTTVTVNTPPVIVQKPVTQQLCSISFDLDKRRPARVDNGGKACLDDLALSLQRSTDAKLYVTGNAAPPAAPKKHHKAMRDESGKLAAERAVNTKDYLVKEKGIDASRIVVFTGTAGTNTVTDTLVPAGADTTGVGGTPVDETTVKPQPRVAPMKKHKKK